MTPRFATVTEGADLGTRTLPPLSRTDLVRYQGASGDMNPIHHDEPFARAAGYPAPLVVGMLPAGALAAWAAQLLGAERVRRTRIRWKQQVWPGDVLTFGGRVTRAATEGDTRSVEVELTATTQAGAVAVQVWMTFGDGAGGALAEPVTGDGAGGALAEPVTGDGAGGALAEPVTGDGAAP